MWTFGKNKLILSGNDQGMLKEVRTQARFCLLNWKGVGADSVSIKNWHRGWRVSIVCRVFDMQMDNMGVFSSILYGSSKPFQERSLSTKQELISEHHQIWPPQKKKKNP